MNTAKAYRGWVLAIALGIVLSSSQARAQGNDPASLALAAEQILQARCFACHGQNAENPKGGLNIADRDQLFDPGRKLIIPNNPDGSEILRRIVKGNMPKGKPPLSAEEQAILRDWIASGALGTQAAPNGNEGGDPVGPNPGPGGGQPAIDHPIDLPMDEFIPPNGGPGSNPGPGPGPGPDPRPNGGQAGGPLPLAARVQLIFTQRCFKCHGDKEPEGGIRILDRELLVNKKKLVPGQINASAIFKLISGKTGDIMPPEDEPRLTDPQIADIRDWIASGAPTLDAAQLSAQPPVEGPPEEKPLIGRLGVEYTLQSILQDVRRLKPEDRHYARYFSLTHILDGGATREELTLQRQAFFKAVNHLTWAAQIVQPKAIEPTYTVFRIDLRELGWDKKMYANAGAAYADFTLFDLALLEYPYGVIHENSDAYLGLVREYFPFAKSARPIAYLRTDWFASVATLPPLYHDLLQLPRKLDQLEYILSVNSQDNVDNLRAVRSGMTDSQVSRNNRVVERHAGRFGCYWKSFDFKTSADQENMLKDPINLRPTGGEMVFSLPNGMHGYYVASGDGHRIDFAPTEIVVDKNASDRIVRNGLSCIRCHTDGLKTFHDSVRPTVKALQGAPGFSLKRVLALYPEQNVMDKLLGDDTAKFHGALERILGKPQTVEPLTPVSVRFHDRPLTLPVASAEMGLAQPKNLKDIFRLPQFANMGLSPLGVDRTVHRDTWQDYFDRVVRQLGMGTPIVPLDSLSEPNYEPSQPPPFQLTFKHAKTGNQYSPGEKLFISLKSNYDVYIEVIATNYVGVKKIWVPSSTKIKAGEEYRYPPAGHSLQVNTIPGSMSIMVYASTAAFPGGEILRADGVSDRISHPFRMYQRDGKRIELTVSPDPLKTVKKTIDLEIK